jgi:hypothetical protein
MLSLFKSDTLTRWHGDHVNFGSFRGSLREAADSNARSLFRHKQAKGL